MYIPNCPTDSSIWPHIQFTIDIPSDNPNGMIPVLDMLVTVNQVGNLTHQFFVKPVNTPYTILV